MKCLDPLCKFTWNRPKKGLLHPEVCLLFYACTSSPIKKKLLNLSLQTSSSDSERWLVTSPGLVTDETFTLCLLPLPFIPPLLFYIRFPFPDFSQISFPTPITTPANSTDVQKRRPWTQCHGRGHQVRVQGKELRQKVWKPWRTETSKRNREGEIRLQTGKYQCWQRGNHHVLGCRRKACISGNCQEKQLHFSCKHCYRALHEMVKNRA